MAESISFFVPEEPFVKRRPRFGQGRAYTDPQTRAAEEAVRLYAMRAMTGRSPMTGPMHLSVMFVFEIPRSNRDKKRVAGAPHTQKPDCTNLTKLVEDALNPNLKMGREPIVWFDDAQISDVEVRKRWANGVSGTHVTVTPLEDE